MLAFYTILFILGLIGIAQVVWICTIPLPKPKKLL